MWEWIRRFFAPPIFEDDEDKTRTARLLNTILWANLAIWLLCAWALPLSENILVGVLVISVMILLAFVALILMRQGYIRSAGTLFTFSMWAVVVGLLLISGGVVSPMAVGFLVVVILAGLLVSARAAIAFVGLGVASVVVVFALELGGLLPPVMIPIEPITGLATLVGNLLITGVLLYLTMRSLGEALGRARGYAAELEEQREHLEETVAERTRGLADRARYLEATATIARDASAVLDLQALLSRVVTLISDQLGFYHAGIFLIDPLGEWAVLEAASSAEGSQMLARGHRLQVGQEGIVGYVAGRNEARVALDVGADAVYFDNPDLPETCSEMALPLRARGELIGVLDVQSRELGAFSEEDVVVSQTLADQVAVAISNARLFQRAEESAEAERQAYGELSGEAWRELLRARPDLGYLRNQQGLVPAGDLWRPEMQSALQSGRTMPGDDGEAAATLAVPIKLGEQVIGVIDVRKPEQAGEWGAEEMALVETLTDQVSLALEGARLYQDAQRREVQERMVGEVTARMRESLDVEMVIETAVSEISRALGLAALDLRLGVEPETMEDSTVSSSGT